MSSSSKHHSHSHAHSNSNSHSHSSHTRSHSNSASSSSSTNPHHSSKKPNSYWDTVLQPLSLHDPSRRHDSSSKHTTYDERRKTIAKSTGRECPNCRRSFSSIRAFEDHLNSCPPFTEKPYACDQCGTAFKKNSNLVKHMKLVHLGEKKFACDEPGCGRLFGQKSNLNSHVRAVHRGEKPFFCTKDNCGRRFSQKSGLKAHVNTVHNGERPYVCDCGSSFGHRGDLNRHKRVLHEKQRPFECPVCPGKAFGRKSVLIRHMQTHAQAGHAVSRSFSTNTS